MRATDHRTFILMAVTLAACVAMLAGCSDTSAGPVSPDPPLQYHVRSAPESVLHNIRTSYVWRNASEYLDCLSEDFEFFPDERDVQDPDLQIPPVWYKTDEQSMHQNMFDEDSDIESITLVLTTMSIVYDDGIPGDDLDDTCVCRVGVDLRVNTNAGMTYLASAPSEFYMRVDTDQTGPGGALLWEIEQWYDLGSDGRGLGNRTTQGISWGRVKSLYKDMQ